MKDETEVDIFQSELVPKHVLLTDKEREEFIKELGIELRQLPRIKRNDPSILKYKAKKGDVVKIVRKSSTSGDYINYYRVIVE